MFGIGDRYEFSEADAACALQAIDSWVEGAAHGAQHISPEKVSHIKRLSRSESAFPIERTVCQILGRGFEHITMYVGDLQKRLEVSGQLLS